MLGLPTVWAARYLKMNGPSRRLFGLVRPTGRWPMPWRQAIRRAGRQHPGSAGDFGCRVTGGFFSADADGRSDQPFVQLKLPDQGSIRCSTTKLARGSSSLEQKSTGFLEFLRSISKNPQFRGKLADADGHSRKIRMRGSGRRQPKPSATLWAHDGPVVRRCGGEPAKSW